MLGIISWEVWKFRNAVIFENVKKDLSFIFFKILRAQEELHKNLIQILKAIRSTPIFNKDLAWILIYGACQGLEGRFGGGVVLFMNDKHYFHLELGAGEGTNTHSEYGVSLFCQI